ncbi:MAG: hypothetical protein ACTH31_16900 [Pseudoclavibacter sp.]
MRITVSAGSDIPVAALVDGVTRDFLVPIRIRLRPAFAVGVSMRSREHRGHR